MADSFYGNLFAKITPKPKVFAIGKTNVDLTPAVYKEAVRAREVKKRWILGNAAVFAMAVLATSILFVSGLPAKTSLEQALVNNKTLEASLLEYQEINVAVDQMAATQQKLVDAAGQEIDWVQLISSVENTLPEGTSVSSIGINSSTGDEAKGAALLLTFSADNPLGYADTLRAVQSAPGVSNVQIGGMTSSGESYEFSATLDYDSSIKTNRFPSPGGS